MNYEDCEQCSYGYYVRDIYGTGDSPSGWMRKRDVSPDEVLCVYYDEPVRGEE